MAGQLNSGIWQFITAQLCREFRVTIIDLPGFGRSDMILDYSVENIVEHLLQAIPSESILIGWSLGGLIATKLAVLYPARVSKLICVASTPKFIKDSGWPGIESTALENFLEELNADYEATLMRFILLQFYGMPINHEMIGWLRLNLFMHGKPTIQTLEAGLNLLRNLDLRAELNNLHCPIIYLLGKLDALVSSQTGKSAFSAPTKYSNHCFSQSQSCSFSVSSE